MTEMIDADRQMLDERQMRDTKEKLTISQEESLSIFLEQPRTGHAQHLQKN